MSLATRAVELTRELVRFNTINPTHPERGCAEHLARLLELGGFAVAFDDFAPGRTSLVAKIEGRANRPPLAFTGHIDTVPLGAAPWSRDPFAGETADGKLHGRGSSDMKSGVAAFVVAALDLAKLAERSSGLVLLILAGEESGCEGAFHLARSPALLGRAGALIVAEPSGNLPLVGHKGALWLKARTHGVTAHGSMPHKGVNAIYAAARAVSALEVFRFDSPADTLLGAPTLNVGTISGGLNVNSVPDRAEIGVDIRTTPGLEHSALKNRLQAALGRDVELETVVDVPGLRTSTDEPWIQDVFEIMSGVLGSRPEARAAPYFTDASVLTPAYGGIPTVVLGPGELEMAHQTDEYCRVDRIGQAVDAYGQIVHRWWKA